MNAFISSTYVNTADPGTRQWVWGYIGGHEEGVSLFEQSPGQCSVLYNVYDPHHQSPYASRLNIRMGIEFPFKEKTPIRNDRK